MNLKFKNIKDGIIYFSIKKYRASIISFILIILIFGSLLKNNYSISEQAYFYTLSTISQTLAALIGFIGIFVVFRLQISHSKNLGDLKNLRYLISKGEDMEAHPFDRLDPFDNDDALLENANIIYEKYMKETNGLPITEVAEFTRIVSDLRKNNSDIIHYRKSSLFPLLLGFIGIIISTVFLPLGHIQLPDILIFHPSFPFIAIGLSLAFTIAAIIAIINFLVDLLIHK